MEWKIIKGKPLKVLTALRKGRKVDGKNLDLVLPHGEILDEIFKNKIPR